MSKKKESLEIYIKLSDTGSIYHDPIAKATITGDKVAKVTENAHNRKALRGGAIKKATEAEFKASEKKREALEAGTSDTKKSNKSGKKDKNKSGDEKTLDSMKRPDLLKEAEKREGLVYKGNTSNKDLVAEIKKYDEDPKAYKEANAPVPTLEELKEEAAKREGIVVKEDITAEELAKEIELYDADPKAYKEANKSEEEE